MLTKVWRFIINLTYLKQVLNSLKFMTKCDFHFKSDKSGIIIIMILRSYRFFVIARQLKTSSFKLHLLALLCDEKLKISNMLTKGSKKSVSHVQALGHFALVRSVLWVITITALLGNNFDEIRGSIPKKYFSAFYQFYAMFAIYAYIQLMEGLKHVS